MVIRVYECDFCGGRWSSTTACGYKSEVLKKIIAVNLCEDCKKEKGVINVRFR